MASDNPDHQPPQHGSPPPPSPPPISPESIIPPSASSALEALVFTDIVNSTAIKARLSSQAYISALQRHNDLFAQCVALSLGASIIKHTGDGLFARFQTASEAARCMLRFQRLMSKEPWPSEPLTSRVGIHLGEFALVQMLDRADVVGTPADTAARIMSLATGGQILLSRVAADEARRFLTDPSHRWTRHGHYALKGLDEPIEIWEVADARSQSLPAPVGAVPPPSVSPLANTGSNSPHNRLRYYKIIEKLGEGGMGTVYKAQQTAPIKRTVALKRIKPGLDSREVIARFESERQALALMKHPHIAEVYDAGTDDADLPYFVMEYVEGVPITQYADDNRLTITQRLELFLQVCDAISHAHAKAVIHRDITPRNVMAFTDKATGKPVAKVIDFGIAKALSGDHFTDRTLNTLSGHAIGTLGSMSPEQAAGSPDIDTRSDVYSLGVLLYELLTGSPPFDPKSLQQAAIDEAKRIIREVEPPRPSTRLHALGDTAKTAATARNTELIALASHLKNELEWIPLKALRKERDRRYPSSLALADDIKNYLEGKPLIAGPESKAYLVRKFIHRNRKFAVPLLAAVTIGALAVLVSSHILSDGSKVAATQHSGKANSHTPYPLSFIPSFIDGVPYIPPADSKDGVQLRKWKWIVLHHSASLVGNRAMFEKSHRMKGWDSIGFHFVVGNGQGTPDGGIEITQRWLTQAIGAHTKSDNNEYNEYGIGIVLVGNFDLSSPSESQLASLEKLCALLVNEFELSSKNIIGHSDVRDTDCPGKLFELDVFRSRCQRLIDSGWVNTPEARWMRSDVVDISTAKVFEIYTPSSVETGFPVYSSPAPFVQPAR